MSAQRQELDLEALVAEHRDGVFRAALSVLGPQRAEEAEDVTQEVFLKLLDRGVDFRGDSEIATWLHRIAVNAAIDRRRLARLRRPHLEESVLAELPMRGAGADPERNAAQRHRGRQVAACLDRLPDRYRSVLHLHYWLGHTVAEIAALSGMPSGTVKAQLARGRQRLAGCLTDHRPEDGTDDDERRTTMRQSPGRTDR